MTQRSQYFGIVSLKKIDGKYKEDFLKNNEKVLDIVAQNISERTYYDTIKKNVVGKLYLRIKICYKLYKQDIFSTHLYYL